MSINSKKRKNKIAAESLAGQGHAGWGENKERADCNQLNDAVQDTEMYPGHLPIVLWAYASAVNSFPHNGFVGFQAFFKRRKFKWTIKGLQKSVKRE